MRIAVVGPYPPPNGGISIHIKRMKKYLEKNNIDVSVYSENKNTWKGSDGIYNIKSYRRFIFKIPFIKADILHFHTIDIRVRILLGFYKLLNKKIVLTIHGESAFLQMKNSNRIIKGMLVFSLNKIDKIVCVNPRTIKDLCDFKVEKGKIICIPAYISPVEEDYSYERIPCEVWSFISQSDFLITSNGSIRLHNDRDLYGFDMMLELIQMLKLKFNNVKMLISLLGVEEQNNIEKDYYDKIKRKIIKYGLQNDVYIFEVKDTEFYPILKKSQLFIRPTSIDGYGVSIAEALQLRVPSIASDVCRRPEGTILFKNRDNEDLYNKTLKVIENYQNYKKKLESIEIDDNAEKILNLYRKLLNP